VPQEFVREERAAGKTRYSLRKMLKLAGDGITSFSNRPLKLPLVSGAALALLSAAYLAASIVLVCLDVWDYIHILFALAFLLIAALFVCLGIFGLYLGRIYDEAKARPIYIIEEKINF